MITSLSNRIKKLETQVATKQTNDDGRMLWGKLNRSWPLNFDPEFRAAAYALLKNLTDEQWQTFVADGEALFRALNDLALYFEDEIPWPEVSKLSEAAAHLLIYYLATGAKWKLVMPDEAIPEKPAPFASSDFRCASCRYPVWAGAGGSPRLTTCPACKRKRIKPQPPDAIRSRYTRLDMLMGFGKIYLNLRHHVLNESMSEDHLELFRGETVRREAWLDNHYSDNPDLWAARIDPPLHLIYEIALTLFFPHERGQVLFPPMLPENVALAWLENGITDSTSYLLANADECAACSYPVPRRADKSRIFDACPLCGGELQECKLRLRRRHRNG